MRVYAAIADLRVDRSRIRMEGRAVGLVPTMGALHEGHLSLIRQAKRDCDVVAVSVFVNPTQFGPHDDYLRYPRTLERDIALADNAGADVLFAPEPAEMYPDGFQTTVQPGPIADVLEGPLRPGHFAGAATIVAKMLNIVQPERAYFGRKDYQQLRVVERMVRDLDTPTQIVGCPTVREPDGLAMSSRNAYLCAEERRAATVLYLSLEAAWRSAEGSLVDPDAARGAMRRVLSAEPLAAVQYAEVANPETLQPLTAPAPRAIALLAVFIGRTRLIDNMELGGLASMELGGPTCH